VGKALSEWAEIVFEGGIGKVTLLPTPIVEANNGLACARAAVKGYENSPSESMTTLIVLDGSITPSFNLQHQFGLFHLNAVLLCM